MNNKRKTKLIVVVGPTASGKSELAVQIAKKIGGEIISADSRQVYRGLDIGTGKVNGKWQRANGKLLFYYKKVPHHCIDFVDPRKQFSAAEFKKCAEEAIQDIVSRGKIPILAGGTGFWIDAVVYDMDLPDVPPDQKLRRALAQKSAAALLAMLKRLDPGRAEAVEQKNPRRLIRAIEIAKKRGSVPKISKKNAYAATWIGIAKPKDELYSRIAKRLLRRVRLGMVEETRRLKKNGLPWHRFYELGLEYKFLADYAQKKISRQEFISGLNSAIRDYARRQITWWKRNLGIRWVENPKHALRLVVPKRSKKRAYFNK